MTETDFTKRLRRALEEAGLTHAATAEKIGEARETVSQWARGRSEPGRLQMRALARALGRHPAWLAWGCKIRPANDNHRRADGPAVDRSGEFNQAAEGAA